VKRRIPSAIAALFCGFSVALGAYAAHAADPQARVRLGLAAAFAFGHGLALLALRAREGGLAIAVRAGFIAGTVFFSGSLAGAALLGLPVALAPVGGTVLILAWLLAAADLLRKE
jgi:uncharacterized membrane protein YgdD (TMEM256/DUF423 family)